MLHWFQADSGVVSQLNNLLHPHPDTCGSPLTAQLLPAMLRTACPCCPLRPRDSSVTVRLYFLVSSSLSATPPAACSLLDSQVLA